ncbi:MAG TPA: imidazolonepropionase [Myxococcaceae bacterium]|nr:imidazolonepropionase [Myxococcaceae bacterium]
MGSFDLLIHNASEILSVQGELGDPADQALTPIPRGALGVSNAQIAYLGPAADLPPDAVGPRTQVIDALGGFVGPGFVDPHTHLIFAGERSREFELRCSGATYRQIAESGGGIASTVQATRAASEDELVELGRRRLWTILEQGVTCAEVKSGYGLSLSQELKMLRAIRRVSQVQPVELVATLLCAHAIPQELQPERDRYVDACVREIIPAVAEAGLAKFCDAFVDESAFTAEEARRILRTGANHGLIPRLHADQLADLATAELAAELRASSADHLEHVSESGIEALAQGNVAAVLAPVSSLFLRQGRYAPGRRLIEAGVNVALATNFNPGSSMSENVALTLGLSCLCNGLSPAEAYWGLTRGAALALRRFDLGRLTLGGTADVVVFGTRSYRHLPYHLAINHVRWVLKSGVPVVRADPQPLCDSAGGQASFD